MKVLYNDLDERYDNWEWYDLEALFDNKNDNHRYIVCGTQQNWLGIGTGYIDRIFDSIYEAMQGAMNCGICFIKITEGKYGRLLIDVYHHDGTNHLEIREVTRFGEDLWLKDNTWHDVGALVNRKGATRNVKYLKRIFCKDYDYDMDYCFDWEKVEHWL